FNPVAYVGPPPSQSCPAGTSPSGGPLFLYLQHGRTSTNETLDQSGQSSIANEDISLFAQDTWKIWRNFTFNYGLRWDAQRFPNPTVPPSSTSYRNDLSNPAFDSTGFLPNQNKEFQPRVGFAWDIRGNGKSALRASYGIFYARQNMLTQVGAITTNGVQQQEIVAVTGFNSAGGNPPTFPGTVPVPPPPPACAPFPCTPGVTVFSKDYANPRIYTTNVAYEQQIVSDTSAYVDFTWSKGVHLTRFIDPNVGPTSVIPLNGDTASYSGPIPFPNLGSITDTVSSAKSLYRGVTLGVRKRFSRKFQVEGNYTYSVDKDDDSNERDPFTFRYANLFNLASEYSNSDRDERHKFNFYTYSELPWGLSGNVRMQAHSAQPITPEPRFLTGTAQRPNTLRKDNAFFTFDFALARPFHVGDRMQLIPKL